MSIKKFLLGTVLLSQAFVFAQDAGPITLGLKGGVPVTNMFTSSNTSSFGSSLGGNGTSSFGSSQAVGSNYSSHTPRYIMGVSGEFHIPYNLRMEVDALYKRGGYDSNNPFGGGVVYRPTSFNWWEFPVLLKKNLSAGHFRPFIDVGASLRHISTITQTSIAASQPYPLINDNAGELHNRNSYGGVAGIGMTFKKGPFELTPEARYTRWSNQAFVSGNGGLRTNLDQGDVLLGISF